MRSRRAVLLLGLTVVAVAGGCAQVETAGLPVSEYPPAGTATPAVCPPTWESHPAQPTRGGLLVPNGGTEALLCTYPIGTSDAQGRQHLSEVRRLADPAELITYLNGLPTRPNVRPGVEWACPAVGTTQHTLVIGYPDREAALVRMECGFEQGGNIRYQGDLDAITSLFATG